MSKDFHGFLDSSNIPKQIYVSLQTVSLLGCTQLLEVTIPHEVQLVCQGFLNFRDNHHVDLQLSLSRHVPYGEPEISPVSVTWMPTFQLRSPVTVARLRCTGPQHPWPPQHSWVPWLQWHGYLSRLAAQLSSKLWIHLGPKIFEVKRCQNHHNDMTWWKIHTHRQVTHTYNFTYCHGKETNW